MRDVTGTTTMLATFGNPNIGSLAPAAYNAAFEAMDVDFVYLALEPKAIGSAMEAVRALGLGGGTITKPFKQSVIEYLDDIDDDAKRIGAVNVVVNEGGSLVGHNSDWHGAMAALLSKTDLKNKRIALLGAGGAARAIAFGLEKNEAKTIIFNRTQESGVQVAERFNCEFGGNLDNVDESFDIVINATTVGFGENQDGVPIQASALTSMPLVFDVIPRPIRTKFVDLAESIGCETISGVSMVAYQAMHALKWLTGVEPSLDVLMEHFSQ